MRTALVSGICKGLLSRASYSSGRIEQRIMPQVVNGVDGLQVLCHGPGCVSSASVHDVKNAIKGVAQLSCSCDVVRVESWKSCGLLPFGRRESEWHRKARCDGIHQALDQLAPNDS